MQHRLISFIEACFNTFIGFWFSLLIWYGILATGWFDMNVDHADNLLITGIFTVASIVRGFAVRRVFVKFHIWLHGVIKVNG